MFIRKCVELAFSDVAMETVNVGSGSVFSV